jgi:hypothetical protein
MPSLGRTGQFAHSNVPKFQRIALGDQRVAGSSVVGQHGNRMRLDNIFGFAYRSRATGFTLWTDHAASTEPQLHIFARQSRDCRRRDRLYVRVDAAGYVLLHGLCALKSAAGLEPLTGT